MKRQLNYLHFAESVQGKARHILERQPRSFLSMLGDSAGRYTKETEETLEVARAQLGCAQHYGDECHWRGFHFLVIDVASESKMLIEIRKTRISNT